MSIWASLTIGNGRQIFWIYSYASLVAQHAVKNPVKENWIISSMITPLIYVLYFNGKKI